MMRKNPFLYSLFIATACLVTSLLTISPCRANTIDFGLRGGVYPDEEQPFLGAEALFSVAQTQRWFGNPNVEHVFVEDGDLTTFSFDFHYDFPMGTPYTIWAGAGPTLIHRDRNLPGSPSTTDAGANLLFGLGARTGDVRPYGQLKVVVADDSEAVLGVGIRF